MLNCRRGGDFNSQPKYSKYVFCSVCFQVRLFSLAFIRVRDRAIVAAHFCAVGGKQAVICVSVCVCVLSTQNARRM